MISIIIAARTGPAPVITCLRSLERLPERSTIEVIVTDCCDGAVEQELRREFSHVLVVRAVPGASIAQARHAAACRATGELIAVLHERYAVREDWVRAVLAAHEGACDVAAGCVAPSARLPLSAWAMYLSEYAHVCPPMPSGPLPDNEAAMVPGGNVTYKRRVLSLADMGQALWELDFHQALLKAGARFVRGANMDVEFAHPFSVREYIAERFAVSRDLAALRLCGGSPASALVYAVTRLALPPVLLARMGGRIARTPYKARLLHALPWMLFFTVVQTWGEMVGALSTRQLERRGVGGARAAAS